MVRELISLQVGQAGTQIGASFWEELRKEHLITVDGETMPAAASKTVDEEGEGEDQKLHEAGLSDYKKVFFGEVQKTEGESTSRWVPRALMVDLEPGSIDTIRAGHIGKFFHPENVIAGAAGAGNNWAKGHYTEGAELVAQVQDQMQKEVERCDCLQGFQLCHSLGGGTGSGMGTLLLTKLRDAYPDKVSATYTVFPSPSVSETVVEPYNATLASHILLENTDLTFLLDNEALMGITTKLLHMNNPSFKEFNNLISRVMLGITSSLRFPGSSNMDLRKLAVNLVPFPRLHFFQLAEAPIQTKYSSDHTKLDAKELVRQCFRDGTNFYSKVNPGDGKYLAASFIFRGQVPEKELDEQLDTTQRNSAESFVEWIPNNMKSALVHIPPTTSRISSTFIANTTSIKTLFMRLHNQFSQLFRRRAFLHWYTEEGMDSLEFEESDKNLRDLVCEYQDKENASFHSDEEAESDEEY